MDDYVKSLPDDWRHDRLKDVAKINQNALGAFTDVDYELDYLEISNVDGNGIVDRSLIEHLRFEDAPSRARRQVVEGSTIISSVRPNLQAAAYIDEHDDGLICSTGFNVVDPDVEKLIPKYLYYCLISDGAKQYFVSTAKGVGYPAIGDKEFGAVAIPLPPRPEQERIAAFLDEKCAAVDKAIEVKRKQQESIEAIWKNLLYRATTQGLSAQTRMVASGNVLFPRIPAGWKVVRIKNIGTLRYGLGEPPETSDDGIPMIRATDFRAGKIDDRKMIRINPVDLPEGRNAFLRTGEIIVVRSGAYAGDSTIIPAKYNGYISGYDMVVTITKAVPEFIAYAFLSKHILDDQLLLLSLRAAQPHVNAEQVLNLGLPLPPKEEQKKIAVYLSRKRDYLESLAANLRKQIEILEQYRKSLIHEYVTGVRRVV